MERMFSAVGRGVMTTLAVGVVLTGSVTYANSSCSHKTTTDGAATGMRLKVENDTSGDLTAVFYRTSTDNDPKNKVTISPGDEGSYEVSTSSDTVTVTEIVVVDEAGATCTAAFKNAKEDGMFKKTQFLGSSCDGVSSAYDTSCSYVENGSVWHVTWTFSDAT